MEEFKERRTFVNEKIILNWLKKLISAINYLHQNNVIHTWINPREIGIESNDEIKLSMSPDLQCISSKKSEVKVNQLDMFYNCPEFWQRGSIGLRYDIW